MAELNSSKGILNAMTVDVEEHFQVSAFADVVARDQWETHDSRVERNTDRVLEVFDEAGVKATFFILGWVAERRPALVRRIAEHGHEVASHGYSHKLVFEQQPEEFRQEVLKSKALLEHAAGQEVSGYRAASFSITTRSLWALDVLAESGFAYDSSIYPVFHDRYGMPGAPRGIHRLQTAKGNSLLEVPPTTMKLGRFVLPVAGGGYLRMYPGALTRWAVERLNRVEKRPSIVYIHPWEVDPSQPRIRASRLSSFRHYSGLNTTVGKLRDLMKRFAFGPMNEVLAREATIPDRLVP